MAKPMFFKMIAKENGFEISDKYVYKYFKTPMDFLQKEINRFNFRKNRERKKDIIPFSDIVRSPGLSSISSRYYEQRDRVLDLIYSTKEKLSRIYCGYDELSKIEKEIVKIEAGDIKQEGVEYINNIVNTEPTMYLLLKSIEDKKHRSIANLIFTTLFGTPNKLFFTMIINNTEPILKLREDPSGNIKIFDYNFSKVLA